MVRAAAHRRAGRLVPLGRGCVAARGRVPGAAGGLVPPGRPTLSGASPGAARLGRPHRAARTPGRGAAGRGRTRRRPGAAGRRSQRMASGAGRSGAARASRATVRGWRRPRAGCSAAPTRRAAWRGSSGRSCPNGRPASVRMGRDRPGPRRRHRVERQRRQPGRHAAVRRRGPGRSPGSSRANTATGSPAAGAGTAAVEGYSRGAAAPRRVTLAARDARVGRPPGRTSARDWLWLFGLCVARARRANGSRDGG